MEHAGTFRDLIGLLKALFVPGWEGFLVLLLIARYFHRAWTQIRRTEAELREEEALLCRCDESLNGLLAQGQLPTKQHIGSWLDGVAADSSVRRCLDTVWATRLMPNPDLEAISSMLSQSESGRLSVARTMPNALMLSGLIGTVLGLAMAVSKLGPQIQATMQNSDPRVLTESLFYTLGHMQSAFSCTFWGILLAVLVSRRVSHVSQRQSQFLAELQEFGLRRLAPLVIPRSPAAQLSQIEQVVRTSQQFMERVADLMVNAVGTFNKVLNDAGVTMAKSIGELQSVAGDIHNSLVDVSKNVLDSATTLQASSDRLQSCHSDLQGAYKAMETFFADSRQQLDEQAKRQLDKMGSLQKDFAESAQFIVGAINDSTGHLGGATQAFADAGIGFQQSADSIRQRLDTGFETLASSVKQALESHTSEMQTVDSSIKHIAERMGELADRLDPRMLPQGEWKAVRDSLSACAEELRRIHVDSTGRPAPPGHGDGGLSVGILQDLRSAIQGREDVVSKWQEESRRLLENLAGLVRKVGEGQPTRDEWREIVSSLQGLSRRPASQQNPVVITDYPMPYPDSGKWSGGGDASQLPVDSGNGMSGDGNLVHRLWRKLIRRPRRQ